MYTDPFEKFVHMPVRRLVPPMPVVPRERVQHPPRVQPLAQAKAKRDPLALYRLAVAFGWPAQPTSVRALVEVVSKVSKLHTSDILSQSHVAERAKARHIVAWLSRRFTACTATLIAKQIRRKDHSAALYGIARVDLAIREAPICAPAADTAEAWASVLWATSWPALNYRDPLKLRS